MYTRTYAHTHTHIHIHIHTHTYAHTHTSHTHTRLPSSHQQALGGMEDIPEGVAALLTRSSTDVLSHVAIRARCQGVLLATCLGGRKGGGRMRRVWRAAACWEAGATVLAAARGVLRTYAHEHTHTHTHTRTHIAHPPPKTRRAGRS